MRRFKHQRKKHFVDSQVQGAILRQAALYWLCGSAVFTIVVFIFRIVPPWLVSGELDAKNVWRQLAPMAISSAVLLPIVMYRAILFSHRFVGPMVRFRSVLRQLARGEFVGPIKLRRHDFWQEVANEINQVSARLQDVSASEPKSDMAISEA